MPADTGSKSNNGSCASSQTTAGGRATRTGRSPKKRSMSSSTAVTCGHPRSGATSWHCASWPTTPGAFGGDACPPAAATRVRVRHQPPYVLTDDEVRRLFTAIDSQAMSCYSNKALVDPVLFRVLQGAGLRVSEALNLTLPDVDTSAGTLRIRDSKNGEGRTIPITGRLTSTLDAYTAAAHPAPEHSDYVFYSRAAGRPINQATVYIRFRGYLADAGIPHFTGGPHPHSLRHGFAVANLRRWAADNADLAVMLPYLACYMGHADLRGTQYYLRLTADAYPEVMAKAQIRFGYVIPAPPEDES